MLSPSRIGDYIAASSFLVFRYTIHTDAPGSLSTSSRLLAAMSSICNLSFTIVAMNMRLFTDLGAFLVLDEETERRKSEREMASGIHHLTHLFPVRHLRRLK